MNGKNIKQDKEKLKRDIGLGGAIALVVGSAIGSGIFTAPQNLAAASTPAASIVAWILASAGSILIAVCFANLAFKIPDTGGIVVYTKEAFGEFAGFLIAWVYWVGQFTGNAAIITGCVRYLSHIFPIFDTNRAAAFIMSSLILWGLTLVGIKGVKGSSAVQIITTICKLIPLAAFAVIALIHFNPQYIHTISPEAQKAGGGFATLASAIAITMWAFTGIEASTTLGGEIDNPEKNLKKSIIYGTVIVSAIYILISVLSMGVMPQAKLANSTAPIAEMFNVLTGAAWGGIFISVGVVISTLGSANGGILMATRAAYAAAEDNMFPAVFKKVHSVFKTPHASLIITGVLSNILLIMNYITTLNAAFTFIMLLATLALLPPYAAGAAAELVLTRRQSEHINIFNFIKNSIIPLVTFAYVVYAIYGTGAEPVMWGFILLLIGIPFYVYVKLKIDGSRAGTLD